METIDVTVTMPFQTDDPQAYLQFASMYKDRVVGIVLVAAFERAPGNFSAMFSVGQELPDSLRGIGAGLDSLRSVERWAIDLAAKHGLTLRTMGGSVPFAM